MRYLIFIFILYANISASAQSELKVFQLFHDYFAAGKYDSLANMLSDDFTASQDGKTVGGKKEYLAYITEWDAAFQTIWPVYLVTQKENKIISMESDSDNFSNYLYGGPLKAEFVYTIEKGKINHIEYHFDAESTKRMKAGNQNLVSFYNWVRENHPGAVLYFDKSSAESAVFTKKLFDEFLISLSH